MQCEVHVRFLAKRRCFKCVVRRFDSVPFIEMELLPGAVGADDVIQFLCFLRWHEFRDARLISIL